MIQLSYTLLGDMPAPLPAAPLMAEAAADGVRVTGVWPHRDLHAARRQLAAYLAGVAPERRVRESFTGREKDAATWRAELAAPPSITTSLITPAVSLPPTRTSSKLCRCKCSGWTSSLALRNFSR